MTALGSKGGLFSAACLYEFCLFHLKKLLKIFYRLHYWNNVTKNVNYAYVQLCRAQHKNNSRHKVRAIVNNAKFVNNNYVVIKQNWIRYCPHYGIIQIYDYYRNILKLHNHLHILLILPLPHHHHLLHYPLCHGILIYFYL